MHNYLFLPQTRGIISFIAKRVAASILIFFVLLPVLFIIDKYYPTKRILDEASEPFVFLMAIVLAPLYETFLFQLLPVEILKKQIIKGHGNAY
jgi:hypothetical protein